MKVDTVTHEDALLEDALIMFKKLIKDQNSALQLKDQTSVVACPRPPRNIIAEAALNLARLTRCSEGAGRSCAVESVFSGDYRITGLQENCPGLG